jgi:hypothetical protein
MPDTFMERCLAGEADILDVDAAVDLWIEGDDPRSLPQALGLSPAEYAACVEDSTALAELLEARRVALAAPKTPDAAGESRLASATAPGGSSPAPAGAPG